MAFRRFTRQSEAPTSVQAAAAVTQDADGVEAAAATVAAAAPTSFGSDHSARWPGPFGGAVGLSGPILRPSPRL